MFDQTLSLYPDYAALVAKTPSKVETGSFQSSRIGPTPTGLVGAWHSTNELRRFEQDGTTSSVALEGYDGWVFGVSAATGGRLIVSSPSDLGGQGALIAFDATGKNLGTVAKALPGGAAGISTFEASPAAIDHVFL